MNVHYAIRDKKYQFAKDSLTEYLQNNGYRRTPERYAILHEIYDREDHFDAETLYVHMKRQNYHISRATVYNTLDLLVQSNLVVKHHFDGSVARFEKAIAKPQHDHMVCVNCGKIHEFSDPRISEISREVSDKSGFELDRHTLILYGRCLNGCE